MRTTQKNQFIMVPMLLLIGFQIFSLQQVSALSDKRLCANTECNKIISTGAARMNYNAAKSGMVSFKIGSPVRIFSKEAGSDASLWGIEVAGRRGYAPKQHIREDKVFVKRQNLIEVSTNAEVKESEENTTLKPSELNVEDAKPTTPLEVVPALVENVTKSPEDNITNVTPVQMIDGTNIPLSETIESTTIPEQKQEIEKEEKDEEKLAEINNEKQKEVIQIVEKQGETEVEVKISVNETKEIVLNEPLVSKLESSEIKTDSVIENIEKEVKVDKEVELPTTTEPGLIYSYLNSFVEADHTTTSKPFLKHEENETKEEIVGQAAATKEELHKEDQANATEEKQAKLVELPKATIEDQEFETKQEQLKLEEQTKATIEELKKDDLSKQEQLKLEEQAKATIEELKKEDLLNETKQEQLRLEDQPKATIEELKKEEQSNETKQENSKLEEQPKATIEEAKKEDLSNETKQEHLKLEDQPMATIEESKKEDLPNETKQEQLNLVEQPKATIDELKKEDLSNETKHEAQPVAAIEEQLTEDQGNETKTEQPKEAVTKQTEIVKERSDISMDLNNQTAKLENDLLQQDTTQTEQTKTNEEAIVNIEKHEDAQSAGNYSEILEKEVQPVENIESNEVAPELSNEAIDVENLLTVDDKMEKLNANINETKIESEKIVEKIINNNPQVPNPDVPSAQIFEESQSITENSLSQESASKEDYATIDPNEYYRKLQEDAQKPWEHVTPTILPNIQEKQTEYAEEIYQTTTEAVETQQTVTESVEVKSQEEENSNAADNTDPLALSADKVEHEGLFGTILGTVNSFWSSEKKEIVEETDELQRILYPNTAHVPNNKNGQFSFVL